jgi:hypothetical protein
MFHGKILVGWIMLKENFRRFVLRPILNSIPPFFFPMQPQPAGGGSVETCCIHIRFHFCVPILITSFWLLADCPIPSGAPREV